MPPVKLVTMRGPQRLPGTPAEPLPNSSASSFLHDSISIVHPLLCFGTEASSPLVNLKFSAAK